MIIKVYEQPKVLLAKREFVSYVVDDEEGEEEAMRRVFTIGEPLEIVAKVSSDKCVSGFGYIVYDAENEASFVVDIGLLE
jgi:hypothetical protein